MHRTRSQRPRTEAEIYWRELAREGRWEMRSAERDEADRLRRLGVLPREVGDDLMRWSLVGHEG